VRNHVSSILDKLDLSDRLELVLYAFSHGLAKSPRQTAASHPRPEAADHQRRSRRPGKSGRRPKTS
jgi:hypothetical protein